MTDAALSMTTQDAIIQSLAQAINEKYPEQNAQPVAGVITIVKQNDPGTSPFIVHIENGELIVGQSTHAQSEPLKNLNTNLTFFVLEKLDNYFTRKAA